MADETTSSESPRINSSDDAENERPDASLPETKVIFTDENEENGRLKIHETLDRCRAYMSIACAPSGQTYSLAEITDFVDTLGFQKEIKVQELEALLASFQQEKGGSVDFFLVAEAKSPQIGKDAEVEVLFNSSDPYVEKGALLLRISESTPGEAGEDLYGEVVEAVAGSMQEVTAGDNVVKQKGNEYFSLVEGRALFENDMLLVAKAYAVSVGKDKMEASLTCYGIKNLSAQKVLAELEFLKIVYGIDETAIASMEKKFESNGTQPKGVVVARGTACKKGRDGEVRFHFEINDSPKFDEKQDGSIDIRETNKIQCVAEGDEIATLVPPVDPVSGKDIYGTTLSAPQPVKVSLKAGKFVKVSEDGLNFIAEKNGRPILEGDSMGRKISISDLFHIDGALDLDIGNIDFDGVVEICGDVEDGYEVKATKSVVIHGFLGASNVSAGLDITIEGGSNGKDDSNLLSGRNINATYLEGATVVAEGDITIKREILYTDIKTLGRVTVEEGSIIGGKIIAKRGIESLSIGRRTGIKTKLYPGLDYKLDDACKAIDLDNINVTNEIDKIEKMLEPLMNNLQELKEKMSPEQRQKLEETMDFLKQKKDEKKQLNAKREELITSSLGDSLPEVVVHRHVHEDVIVIIDSVRRQIGSQLKGPLKIFNKNDAIHVKSLSEKKPTDSEF